MKFCSVCDNMLYIKTDSDTKYVCKNCGYTQPISGPTETVTITDTKAFDDSVKYMRYVTPLLLSDPTMPHVSNIVCQNATCNKPNNAPNDVVYVKYDYENLRYLYMCVYCGVPWVKNRATPPSG